MPNIDTDPTLMIDPGPPRRIRCFARGCQEMLRPPTRAGGGDVCPNHGIRCHSSGTYSYSNVRDNLIIDADVFATRVFGHPFKHESHRFNMENSEDALTWNVFRSLQRAGSLHRVVNLITGLTIQAEPRLYLWGLYLTGDSFEPWNLLIDARRQFEGALPVERPLTEPDIGLHLPGQYLILIEAKFTSPNTFYADGPRQAPTALTMTELLNIYCHPSLEILKSDRARKADRVHYQLWRNMVFAEWMANSGRDGTRAYLGSLTRRNQEEESCREFSGLLNVGSRDRFRHISWEEIGETCSGASPYLKGLRSYLRGKTASLKRVFDFKTPEPCTLPTT